MSMLATVKSTPQVPAEWFATPLGRYLLECEHKYVDAAVADVFGFNALQLGLPEQDFLRASRIPLKCRIAPSGPVALLADFSEHPHQILREVQRVLMPEGHAVIVCFNPRSLWGLRRVFSRARDAYPWR